MSRSGDPKPHQFRNLAFTHRKPAFLANASSALRGEPAAASSSRGRAGGLEVLDPSRPAIPVRPSSGGEDDEDDEGPLVVGEEGRPGASSDEDEGGDGPVVVVLKEGKHLSKEEADAERLRARENPTAASEAPSSSRPTIKPSLHFSSSSSSSTKRKPNHSATSGGVSDDSWDAVVKRVKAGGDAKGKSMAERVAEAQRGVVRQVEPEPKIEKDKTQEETDGSTEKEEKKRKKAERKEKVKKAKGLMSFADG